jgi:hypothetical protein
MPLDYERCDVHCFRAKSTSAVLEGLHAACFIPLNPNAPQQAMAQSSLSSKTALLRPQHRIHAQNVTIFGTLAAGRRMRAHVYAASPLLLPPANSSMYSHAAAAQAGAWP